MAMTPKSADVSLPAYPYPSPMCNSGIAMPLTKRSHSWPAGESIEVEDAGGFIKHTVCVTFLGAECIHLPRVLTERGRRRREEGLSLLCVAVLEPLPRWLELCA